MIFSRLPELFFTPLASPNRRHYAALLLVYHRLFLEYHHGVERELVVDRFATYFASLDEPDALEPDEGVPSVDEATDPAAAQESEARDPRIQGSQALRRLISYGWMDEEEPRRRRLLLACG